MAKHPPALVICACNALPKTVANQVRKGANKLGIADFSFSKSCVEGCGKGCHATISWKNSTLKISGLRLPEELAHLMQIAEKQGAHAASQWLKAKDFEII